MQNLEAQVAALHSTLTSQIQDEAHARNTLDQAQIGMDRYISSAKRKGLHAYQEASELRVAVEITRGQQAESQRSLADALSDPLLPFAWVPNLWELYKRQWAQEKAVVASGEIVEAMKKRDKRILQTVSRVMPVSTVEKLKDAFKADLEVLGGLKKHRVTLGLTVNPEDIEERISSALTRTANALSAQRASQSALDKAERHIGAIPADEQLGELVNALSEKTKTVSDAQAVLTRAIADIVDTRGRIAHLDIKINASRARLLVDFKEKSYEAKSLEASARAKQAFALFKDRMLAAKARWLSETITHEFRNLLRKKTLFDKVLVDPVTYRVSIEDLRKHELPMERLSAGERQLLAIAVLSALISERKGRFPVVVDTPLARLDRHHREALVRRFFSTVSHQVIVLSTDEEVEGSVYDALRPFTTQEYVLQFDDTTRSTKVKSSTNDSDVLRITEAMK